MNKTMMFTKRAYALRASIADAISFASESYHVDLFKHPIPDATEYIYVYRTDGITTIGMTVLDTIYHVCNNNNVFGNVTIKDNRLTVVIAVL